MKTFKFIDLFAGIGAFHIALEQLGGECIFASEVDKKAIEVYEKNFNLNADNDMFKINPKNIPKHDVLCAGFPCQPFSNAGNKLGFSDTRGTLFFEIERVLQEHKTKFIILENVKGLVNHNNGNTYSTIIEHLKNLGYILTKEPVIISPHHLGIPQNRERIFIIGIHKDYYKKDYLEFMMPDEKDFPLIHLYDLLDKSVSSEYNISPEEKYVFDAWENFKNTFSDFPHPVLVDEFGETYDTSDLQLWKQQYCKRNRDFYLRNKKEVDDWINKYNVKDFKKRDRKFEWQAGKNYNSVYETLIQLRQSGIRCKKPLTFPALVAIVQTSIVGQVQRRITPREAARLQSFPENFILHETDAIAYKQLGNSANIEVIKYVAKQLFKQGIKEEKY
jgi:DNA (cytosine-5)-methyltransferase 1